MYIYVCIHLSIYLSIDLSVYLFTYLLSIYLYPYPYIYIYIQIIHLQQLVNQPSRVNWDERIVRVEVVGAITVSISIYLSM